jgi:hypothetical protein
MLPDDVLQCSCGWLAFRCIHFPEPLTMKATCFSCGKVHTVNLAVIAAELAWRKAEQEAPVPVAQPASEPVKTGYKYESML